MPSALRPEPSVVAAPAGRGCENLGVPAASRLGRWGSATAFGAIAASIGVLAGIDPRFAIAATLSLGLLLVMLADLYVGLLVFVVLNFAAQVPSVAGPGLSVVKIAGLMLAISWLACQPTVASVLTGATKPEQVAANAAAVAWRLTPDDLAAVDAIVAQEGEAS